MVAVPMSPDAIAEYLSADVDLATVNDPGGCVVAGSDENIRKFSERLAEAGIAARRVRTSHAFHSRLMDPVLPEFQGFLSRLTLRAPQIPLLSNVTGTWMSETEATNPATWARQVRATVRFADEVDALLADPQRVLVEVGPGGTLTASAMRHPRWSNRSPRRSPDAPPRPEPRRPRHLPAGAGATLVGGGGRRLDTLARWLPATSWYRFPAILSSANGIG